MKKLLLTATSASISKPDPVNLVGESCTKFQFSCERTRSKFMTLWWFPSAHTTTAIKEPQFQGAEQLKNELRDIVCGANYKGILLRKITGRMDEIRHFYGGADGYGDEELAEMMLRDACFLLRYMEEGEEGGEEGGQEDDLIESRMGMSGALFMYRDVFLLANQIPLWLLNSVYEGDKGQSMLCNFLSLCIFGDYRIKQLPWGNGGEEEEPLHLLEAIHSFHLRGWETAESSKFSRFITEYIQPTKRSAETVWQMWNRPFWSVTDLKANGLYFRDIPFWSVTDLKAKGIHFRRSSRCLTDIKFFPLAFYAQLHLPIFYVSYNSVVLLSNAIAFQMSPTRSEKECIVSSYVNFMKTLIDKASDVKELREKGILSSILTTDEEVVRMFKSIDTYGFRNEDTFFKVKKRIEEHCNSKAKTWMADLINTEFRSPWTAIALTAATFLLCLTFLQTYYTINPRK